MRNQISLSSNIIYNIVYQLLIVIVPLVTAPYLSRKLGAEVIGTYSYVSSISTYFTLFAMLGISTYGNRLIARNRDDIDNLSCCFWSLYLIQFLTFLCATTIYILCVLTVFEAEKKGIYLTQIIVILAGLLDVTWFFQGMENFRRIVIRNTLVKLVSMFLIFLLVRTKDDLTTYALIMAMSTFFGQFVMWPYILRMIHFKKISYEDVRIHFKPIIVIFFPSLATSCFTVMDRIIIGLFATSVDVGIYDYAEKIISTPKSTVAALGAAMLPRMSNLVANGNTNAVKQYISLTYYIILPLAFAIAFGIAGVADCFAVVYWGEEFAPAGRLMAILCIAFVFSAIGNVLRTQYLIPNMRDKEYITAICVGSFINIVSNLFVIRIWGAIGACITTVLAEACITVLQFLFSRNEYSFKGEILKSIPYLLSGIFMYGTLKIIDKLLDNSISKLFFMVVIGGFAYTLLASIILIAQRNFEAMQIKKAIYGKLRRRNRHSE